MDNLVIWEIPKKIVDNDFKVYFDAETGLVRSISKKEVEESKFPHITVTFEEVKPYLEGKENPLNLKVFFDIKTDSYQLQTNDIEQINYLVDDIIHHVTFKENADISLVKDHMHTCWKLLISSESKTAIINKNISQKGSIEFSVTHQGDPNILCKTLKFDFGRLVRQSYDILPYDQQFEFDNEPISVYTIRKFNTYSFEVIND
jgi:hypothetical protein